MVSSSIPNFAAAKSMNSRANEQLRQLHEKEDELLESTRRGTRVTARRIMRRLASYSSTSSSVVASNSEIDFCEKYNKIAEEFVGRKKKKKKEKITETEIDDIFAQLKNEYPQFFGGSDETTTTKCLATIMNATKSVQKLKEYLVS